MDGLTMAALRIEWAAQFLRARIDKIHQPNEKDIVLTVRNRDGSHRLLLSANRATPRAHTLRRYRPSNPEEPPMFCMLLRKHLEGGRIADIRQQEYDRVLEIYVDNTNEIGDVVRSVLILEVMGKHSNLILCRTDTDGRPSRIIDSVVHVTSDMSRVRSVLPGLTYVLPPAQTKKMIEAVTPEDLFGVENALSPKEFVRHLTGVVAGIGPVTAREAVFRASSQYRNGLHQDDASRKEVAAELSTETVVEVSETEALSTAVLLLNALRGLFDATLNQREDPSIGLDDLGRPASAAPFALHSAGLYRNVSDMSDALEQVYTETLSQQSSTQAAKDLKQAIDDNMDKLRGKLTSLREEFELANHFHEYQVKGELLTAYLYQVEKGQSEIELPNFYEDEQPVLIELDPALSAIENAQRYFKQSSRRKRALPLLTSEIERSENDLRYLEEMQVHLRDADRNQIDSIREELEQQGFVRKRGNRRKGPQTARRVDKPDCYESSDGYLIRVGRNNLQNDRLTLKSSDGSDIWLHVKGEPGSHVVIEARKREVPQSTLAEAALLAAFFSKARDSGNVSVDYTHVKHIWKPNGARPGHVLYEGQKTLYVTPDRTLIEPILARKQLQ